MKLILNPAYNSLRLDYWFGDVDTRGLSLFRILFGLLLLKDALYHLPLSRIFYSDEGVLPLETLAEVARTNRFSLMDALPYPWMASVFFVLWVIVVINLIVGNRTTLMTVLNFILILSVHERNTYVLNGADTMMRVLSFWIMFLPLNHHYSVDALRKRRHDYLYSRDVEDLQTSERSDWAFVLRLVQIQIALVYIFASVTKIPTGVWLRGEALYFALQIEPLLLTTGEWLFDLSTPGMLRLMTWIAYFTEAAWVFLVFAPIFQPTLRRVGLALGVLFHTGIALTMAIPNFSMVMVASYLLFIDRALLDRVGGWLRPERSINLHNLAGWRWLAAAITRRGSLTMDQALPETPPHEALRRVPFPRLMARFLGGGLPPPSDEQSQPPQSERFLWRDLQRGVSGFIAASAMVLVVWWNVAILDDVDLLPRMEGPPRVVLQTSGLWQSWKLFAPYPSRVYGWIAIPGVFEDETTYDLRTGAPLGEDYARWVFGPNNRWRKYEERSRRDGYEELLEAWGSYYCRTYSALPEGEQLATLEIHYVWRRTPEMGEPMPEYETRLLWKHWCSPEYAY